MHEVMQICCAVCGPLTRDEAASFFSEEEEIRAGVQGSYLFRVIEQPPFPWLKTMFQSSPGVQKICNLLMSRRRAVIEGIRIPEHERCIAAARYALLTRDTTEFQRFHRIFCGIRRLGMRAGMEHEEFWNGVLGAEWQGMEEVPSGCAQAEIYTMCARRYTMLPSPAGPMDFSKLPYMLMLGMGMLRADIDLKPVVVEAKDASWTKVKGAEDVEEEIVFPIVRAYWSTWAGDWSHAYSSFACVFKSRGLLRYRADDKRMEALLLVASIVAIRAKATQRAVQFWVNSAREIMLSMLAAADTENRDDLSGFFDGLILWDSVQNRNSRYFELPAMPGPLSCIPLAIAAPAILERTGVHLPVTKLIAATLETQKRGLTLLAHYAASSLLMLPGLTEQVRAQLTGITSACSFKALYEGKASPEQDNALPLKQLRSIVESMPEATGETLYWDVALNDDGDILSIEPRLVDKKAHAMGKQLEADDPANTSLIYSQDERDLALSAVARTLGTHQNSGIPMLAQTLAGHPRLRLVQGSYRRMIHVRTAPAIIRAEVKNSSLILDMDVKQFTRLKEEKDSRTQLSIPNYHPRMQVLVDYFRKGAITLDMTRREELRWLLAKLAECFELQGKIPATLLKCTKSHGRYIFHAKPRGKACTLELLVEHLKGNSSEISVPGEGDAVLMVKSAAGEMCIRRDLEEERKGAQRMIENCPSLHKTEALTAPFTWQFSDTELLLQAIHELQQVENTGVHWAKPDDALTVLDEPTQPLVISVLKEHSDWLEIGAELAVDEKRVYELSALMAAYEKRAGRYIRLSPGCYMRASAELLHQLGRMSDCLRMHKKKRNALPLAAVPSLMEQWPQKEALPAAIRERKDMLRESNDAPVPSGFCAQLRDYQLSGYRWMLSRVHAGLGACLADDMGLGKTVQTLALLLQMAPKGPSLVIAPLSLMGNWAEEAKQFAPELRVHIFNSMKRAEGMPELKAGDVALASYGQVASNSVYFRAVEWNLVVLDEAQAIKNPTSLRAQAVCKLSASARICLSGTPVENNLMDLWSIMHFLNPMLLGTRAEFNAVYKGDVDKLRRVVAPLLLRRTKEEVLPQLPPITEKRINVELSAEERALYESCRRQALEQARSGNGAITLLAELTRLRRLCCHGKLVMKRFRGQSSKLNAMVELVEELREAGHSALVFSQFTDVLDLAQAALRSKGVSTLRLDGTMTNAKREKQVKLFQQGQAQVFLISLKAGGVGLNLTAADYVILLDPWWNPAVEDQAAGRSHRIGQNKPVTVCRLIASDTVEERVMAMHEAKQALADNIVREGTLPLETLRDILINS